MDLHWTSVILCFWRLSLTFFVLFGTCRSWGMWGFSAVTFNSHRGSEEIFPVGEEDKAEYASGWQVGFRATGWRDYLSAAGSFKCCCLFTSILSDIHYLFTWGLLQVFASVRVWFSSSCLSSETPAGWVITLQSSLRMKHLWQSVKDWFNDEKK